MCVMMPKLMQTYDVEGDGSVWCQSGYPIMKSDGGQIPLVQEPVLPGTYEVLTQQSADVTIAGLAILSGVFLVIVLDWFAKKNDV